MKRQRASQRWTPRTGMTLVEVLVALAIVSVLIGFVLSGIRSINSQTPRRLAEFQQISDALEKFRAAHRIYPPSRIVLLEDGKYNPAAVGMTALATNPALVDHSVRMLKSIFPEIKLKIKDTDPDPTAAQQIDWNHDGDTMDSFELRGPHCLVFFLAGIPDASISTSTNIIMKGFSKDPLNPGAFSNMPSNATVESFYTFPNKRLVLQPTFVPGTGNFTGPPMPVFYDPESGEGSSAEPIIYLSAYEGKGYEAVPADFATPGLSDSGTAVNFAPYQYVNSKNETKTFKPDSFQLIAPGENGKYGTGGVLPLSAANRDQSADNLTNIFDIRLGNVTEVKK